MIKIIIRCRLWIRRHLVHFHLLFYRIRVFSLLKIEIQIIEIELRRKFEMVNSVRILSLIWLFSMYTRFLLKTYDNSYTIAHSLPCMLYTVLRTYPLNLYQVFNAVTNLHWSAHSIFPFLLLSIFCSFLFLFMCFVYPNRRIALS